MQEGMSEGDNDIEGAAGGGDVLIGANVGKRSIGGLAMMESWARKGPRLRATRTIPTVPEINMARATAR